MLKVVHPTFARRQALWIMLATVSFVLVLGCVDADSEPAVQPEPTVDIIATVENSVEQTAIAATAFDSTVLAAVKSTREASVLSESLNPTLIIGPEPVVVSPTADLRPTPTPTTPPDVPERLSPVPPTAVPTVLLTPTHTPTPTVLPTLPPVPTPTIIPTPRVLSLSDLVEEVRDSVIQVVTDRGLGSGAIIEIDSSGAALVITNQHVIEGASTIDVVYSENASFSATVVGVDSLRDLAVLRICCDTNFSPLEISSASSIPLGTSVIALGFPLGVDSLRVSQGIVSGEQFNPVADRSEIQTDASINPGNSGGPLLLLDGTIAGINTYVVRSTGGGISVEGFGFAIASETLNDVVPGLAAGAVVAAPSPTPHPFVSNGKYVDTHGFDISPPKGWLLEQTAGGVVIWDEHTGAVIVVEVSDAASGYNTISQFIEDWVPVAGNGWTNFAIESERTIGRLTSDGTTSVEGHEFDTRFTFNQTEYEGFTHWFVRSNLLYQVDYYTPRDVWQLPEYAGLRLEQQLAFVSFHPPRFGS